MIDNLTKAKMLIDEAIGELKSTPEKKIIAELLAACEIIDAHYKEACDDIDDALREKQGTAYRDGWNMEYYIESDWWHQVSIQLRKLKETGYICCKNCNEGKPCYWKEWR